MILWATSAPTHDGREENLKAVLALRAAQEVLDAENIDSLESLHEALKMIRGGQAFAVANFDDIEAGAFGRICQNLNNAGMLVVASDEQPDVALPADPEPEPQWSDGTKAAIVAMGAAGGLPQVAVILLMQLRNAMPDSAHEFEDAIDLMQEAFGARPE